MRVSRRSFLKAGAALSGAAMLGWERESVAMTNVTRVYNLCVSPDALEADAELLDAGRRSGITNVWLTGFLYGYWYYPIERISQWRRIIEQAGMAAHIVNVPLGHPGDSMGAKSGALPLTPPVHWKPGVKPDGTTYAGTSLHPPATEENAAAMKVLQASGVKQVFVDDDFRLARGPGIIGGCYCDAHKKEFLQPHGYGDGQWNDLLEAVKSRALTPVLRQWVEFTCDQLTACFRAQQSAAPEVRLGIMVMYLGSEKAGIRLNDYRDVPFRVGELMFDDASFSPVKGKTNELFSALFHRRFARAELAFSETTAFPADKLSARNMAAKLVVSTIADVRNTMFMSGITAFPHSHWDTLGPAMKRQAEIHAVVAGHTPRGPFKHFWGECARMTGDDDSPYSLFLAAGVPFEATDAPAKDGWTFLGDADARAAAANDLHSAGTVFIARPELNSSIQPVAESLPGLFAFKREILPRLGNVPYVEEDKPVVCAWYPTAQVAVLWNLSEQREDFTVRYGDQRRTLSVEGLDAGLVRDL